MSEPGGQIKIQHEYVTDATFVPRLFRAYVAFRVLRPSSMASLAFIALVAAILGFSVFVGRNVNGLLPFVALVVALGVIVLLYAFILVALRRGMARNSPVGTRYAVGLGEDAMRIEGPFVSSEVRYAAFRTVAVKNGFVFLQQRTNKQYSALPIELLPGADLDRLRSAVARANPYS